MAELDPQHRSILKAYADSTAMSGDRRAVLEQALALRAETPLDIDIDIDIDIGSTVSSAAPKAATGAVAKATMVSLLAAATVAGAYAWTQRNEEATTTAPEVLSRHDASDHIETVEELPLEQEHPTPEPEVDTDIEPEPVVPPPESRPTRRAQPDRSADEDALATEVEALRRATESNAAGRHREALARLDRWEKRHRSGALDEAREVARLIALCGLDRHAELEKRRKRFFARYPSSAHRNRVAALCTRDE